MDDSEGKSVSDVALQQRVGSSTLADATSSRVEVGAASSRDPSVRGAFNVARRQADERLSAAILTATANVHTLKAAEQDLKAAVARRQHVERKRDVDKAQADVDRIGQIADLVGSFALGGVGTIFRAVEDFGGGKTTAARGRGIGLIGSVIAQFAPALFSGAKRRRARAKALAREAEDTELVANIDPSWATADAPWWVATSTRGGSSRSPWWVLPVALAGVAASPV